MNLKQRIILAITLLLAALAGLCPPWRTVYTSARAYGGAGSEFAGFSPLWRPRDTIDLRVLFVEWAAILFIGLAIALLLGDRKKP